MTADTAQPAASDRGEFSKGWTVLLAGVLGVMCGASPIPYNVIGFTAEPLQAEFGWSQTEVLLPITLFGVIASFLAPVFGWMADRFGVRPVARRSWSASNRLVRLPTCTRTILRPFFCSVDRTSTPVRISTPSSSR